MLLLGHCLRTFYIPRISLWTVYWVCKSQIIQEVELMTHKQSFNGWKLFSVPATSWTWCKGFKGLVPNKKEKASQRNYRKQGSPCQHCISLHIALIVEDASPAAPLTNVHIMEQTMPNKNQEAQSTQSLLRSPIYWHLDIFFRIAMYEKWKTSLGFAEARTTSVY